MTTEDAKDVGAAGAPPGPQRDSMTSRRRIAVLTALFAVAMLIVALLRLAEVRAVDLGGLAGIATPLYVVVTIVFIVLLSRAGTQMGRIGFGVTIHPLRALALGALGIALLRVSAYTIEPFLEDTFGAGRDLTRFADVAGSPMALLQLLALSWTVAAFGEEIAFRIVMMRGLATAFGDGRSSAVAALVVQAAIFGLVHLYQGPSGVAGAFVSGLVFGAVTLLARGSIWPAVIAHGGNNTIGILSIYHGAPL